jgi:hypothetical protein
MCTVTYIPVRNGFYLTSSRDEKQTRPRAQEPLPHTGVTGTLLFPKDSSAGGTWFVAHEKGFAAVLLNGAVQKHIAKPPYRRSRGLILLYLTDQPDPLQAFHSIDLDNIEPFTIILVKEGQLQECRWDGSSKYHRPLDAASPHIWSSVTLYSPEVIRKREQWFRDWLQGYPLPDTATILSFHQHAGDGDSHNDVLMDRNGEMLTVSVTCLEYQHTSTTSMRMIYQDIATAKTVVSSFLTPSLCL